MVRLIFAFFCVLLCLQSGGGAVAAKFPELGLDPYRLQVSGDPGRPNLALGFKKFLNSFTSYQFPSLYNAAQDPLSRLEFPIDQWFVGLSTKYSSIRWSLNASVWRNINRSNARKMQDSDWDDENNTDQKTVFSESNCKLNQGVLGNLGITVGVPYLRDYSLRPAIGYRYQKFDFTTYDGYQTEFGGATAPLVGDGMNFRQTFHHCYIGISFNKLINLANYANYPQYGNIDLQIDYAWVSGKNEDNHLMREGNRITVENTRGHCWHIGAGANIYRNSRLSGRFEADFKRIKTYGTHNLTNNLLGLDLSWDGAKVWSDQLSLTAIAAITF